MMARKIILCSCIFFFSPLFVYGITGRWVDLVLWLVRIDKYFHCYNIILLTIENWHYRKHLCSINATNVLITRDLNKINVSMLIYNKLHSHVAKEKIPQYPSSYIKPQKRRRFKIGHLYRPIMDYRVNGFWFWSVYDIHFEWINIFDPKLFHSYLKQSLCDERAHGFRS